MSFRFVHAADIHLGYQQYGSNDRFADFFTAFDQVVDYAITHKVDCVIIAGDLFHKRIIDPMTLYLATQAFNRLFRARIPAVVVQGNHELADPQQKVSWLDYLARMHLLVMLNPEYVNQKPRIVAYDRETCKGAYIDLRPDVRIWGVKYLGASIRRALTDLTEAFQAGTFEHKPYTIGVLHTGLEGVLDHYSGSLARADLDAIRPFCDYLAMGHIHLPFTQDDWIYNPGSTETNSMDEWQWKDRGFFDVTVDETTTAGEPFWQHKAVKIPIKRRRFEPIPVKVSSCETPEALLEEVDRAIANHPVGDDRPVVELRLTGHLVFDRGMLDRDALEKRLQEAYEPIVCRIKDNTQPNEFEIDPEADLTPEQLERTVLQELVANDATKRDNAHAWAAMILEIKQLALGGRDPQPVLDEVVAFCESLDGDALASELEEGDATC